ncbi:MAG: serine hydrolase [Deltaproteobacteria bacterium]|nr:serine hydrolase [Deltaproteobacteria bacterium]
MLILLVLSLGGAGWYLQQAIPIGTGYTAKYICSAVFLSGRNPNRIFNDDILPVEKTLTRLIDVDVDYQRKTVTTRALFFFESQAVYREGLGCTLLAAADDKALTPPSPPPPPRVSLPADRPWPSGGVGPRHSVLPGFRRQKLEQALDRHFSETGPEKKKATRAVLVVQDGNLVAERYAPGFRADMPLLGWSMAKSVTNALIGILVQQGKLRIHDPAPVPEWSGPQDPRRRITIDQLLRMSSGLKFDETYKPLHGVTRMLYRSADFATFAAAQPPETEPDRKWYYSSGTANILARVVRRTAESSGESPLIFMRRHLFDKIGMTSAVFETDPSGTFVGSSYLFATPRDWARFGLLYLRDGMWNGERLLPEGWVRYSTTPTPPAPKGKYGAHFWLNAGSPGNPGDRPWPRVPADAFLADGYQGQRVVIIPSRKLVVVRFGLTPNPQNMEFESFLVDVLEALPKIELDGPDRKAGR